MLPKGKHNKQLCVRCSVMVMYD